MINELKIETVEDKLHNLTDEQQSKLKVAISMFPSYAKSGLGRTSLEEHVIEVDNAAQIKQRNYHVSPAIQKIIDTELQCILDMGVIEPSNSAWSSLIVIVRKSNGKNCLCLDVRKLNAVTKKDAYPTPIVNGLLSRLADTTYISSIDLKDAF